MEFQEVMKQWQRMCESMQGGISKCDNCPLLEVICQYRPNEKEHFAEAEKIIANWAAKNPEPVYPTWKEWLEEQRVVVHFDSVSEKGTKVKWELTNKSNCRIPADIAEKLGIEPKEG